MPSRKIEDCHPALQPLLTKFLAEAKARGSDVLVTCTYRSNAEQAALYAQGRTTPGARVTNAKPGESRHNDTLNARPASTAFDVVPVVNGKPQWDASHPAWKSLEDIGKKLGPEWAGECRTFREFLHFQLPKRPAP